MRLADEFSWQKGYDDVVVDPAVDANRQEDPGDRKDAGKADRGNSVVPHFHAVSSKRYPVVF